MIIPFYFISSEYRLYFVHDIIIEEKTTRVSQLFCGSSIVVGWGMVVVRAGGGGGGGAEIFN